jgi:hypothetical protein
MRFAYRTVHVQNKSVIVLYPCILSINLPGRFISDRTFSLRDSISVSNRAISFLDAPEFSTALSLSTVRIA